MKKIFSIFLCALLVLGTMSMAVSAGVIGMDDKIYCLDWLDFSADSTALWAEYNAETGEWEQKKDADGNPIDGVSYNQPENEDGTLIAPAISLWNKSYTQNLSWSLTENGEVLHLEVTGPKPDDVDVNAPGLSFMIDEYHQRTMKIGSETHDSDPSAEYVKIRVRNYSSANRFTFAFCASSTNNYKFVNATISDLKTDKDGKNYVSGSGEWQTYVFSMRDINVATNYEGLLDQTMDKEGQIYSRWGGLLSELILFPFGFDVNDGTGAYPGAAIDIDYIVIGSEKYVRNYESELEKKEKNITKLEMLSVPTKKTYYAGEALDLTGLQLRATYADGTTEMLDSASTTVNLSSSAKSTPVTLKFGSQSVSYDIEVIGITGIEVIEKPASNTYEVEDIKDGFAGTDFKIKVSYEDGTSNSDIDPTAFRFTGNFTTPGTQTVTANYYGFSDTFDINVINVVDLEIEQKKVFRYGDNVATGNLNIYLVYSDGSKKLSGDKDTSTELTFEITGVIKTPGKSTITIHGTDEDLGVDITKDFAVDTDTPVEMKVTSTPTKTTYQAGEEFDSVGLAVSLVYEDGKSVKMLDGDYRFRYDFSGPGEKDVTILSNIEGLDLRTTTPVKVEGQAIVPTQPVNTTNGSSSNGAPIGLIIGIVAAVLVIVAVVVIVIISKKKKK